MTSREFKKLTVLWQDIAWIPKVESAKACRRRTAPAASRCRHTPATIGGNHYTRTVIRISSDNHRTTV